MDENIDDKIAEVPADKTVVAALDESQASKLKEFLSGGGGDSDDSDSPKKDTSAKPKTIPEDFRDGTYDPMRQPDFVADDSSLVGLAGIIESSDLDKQKFIKAVLNDTPVVLDIPLLDGGCELEIRSKTAWEQTLIYEAAVADQDDKIVSDYYQAMIQMQKYGVLLQINKVAGKVFSTHSFNKPDGDWREQREKLRKLRIDELETLNSAKLTLLLNGLRIFEYKLSEMTAFCNDGNFWKPAD